MGERIRDREGTDTPRPELAFFQDLFPRIFANAVEGIFLTTTDGRIHAANPAACRILGRTEQEICRLGRQELFDHADPRMIQAIEERLRTGRSLAQVTVVRPDGTRVEAAITSTVLTEPGPASPAVVFLHDITERVQAERALASERALLDRVFASLGDAVFVADARTRVIVRANAAAERIFGWTPAELTGRDGSALYPTREAFEAQGRSNRAAWSTKGFNSGELDLVRKDGSRVPVRYFSRGIPDEGGAFSLGVVVLHDLTEERHAEEERARLQAAFFRAQKLEGLGVLTGGLAHDFNNLLVPILANATALAPRLPPGDPVRGALEDIAASARQAAAVVGQLLAYAGKSAGAFEHVNLADELGATADLLRASLPKKVALRMELPAEPLRVLGDAAQLKQVLVNLVMNAGESMGDGGGHVVVTAGTKLCREGHPALALAQPPLPPGEYVWVEVADDGPGMSEDLAARALDPFFTTKGLGRGLGLPAASGIVRAHHGALDVDSAPQRGTRIRAWLPVDPEASAPAPPPADSVEKVAEGGRILVVDDEQLVRRTVRRLLEKSGYEVTEASDGVEALERFRAAPDAFDLVLLDLSMPRMSGDETFEALRRIRGDLPVVLSSGYAAVDEFDRLLRQPHVRFASKPYDLRELLAALRGVRAGGDGG